MLYFMTIHPSPPRAFVSILSIVGTRINLCHGGSIGDHVEKVNMDVDLVAH